MTDIDVVKARVEGALRALELLHNRCTCPDTAAWIEAERVELLDGYIAMCGGEDSAADECPYEAFADAVEAFALLTARPEQAGG